MYKRGFILYFYALLILTISSFANTNVSTTLFQEQLKLSKEELSFIKNNPTISIAMMPNFKPFSFIENDTHQGYSVDILKQISKISGLNFEIKHLLWTKGLKAFKEKEVDIIAGISKTKQREAFTLFTSTYYEIPTFVFGQKKDTFYKDIKSLYRKKVAISQSMYYKDTLIKHGIDVVEVESSKDKARLLALGKVDYFLSSFTSGKKAVTSQGLTNIKPLDEFKGIKKEDLRFGINKNIPLLHSIIEKSLLAISGVEKNRLKSKWIIDLKEPTVNQLLLTSQEQIFLKNNPVITMCNEPKWAPIEYAHNNKPNDIRGIAIDTLKLLEKKLNVNFKTIPTKSWQESLAYFKAKKCDILPAIAHTKKRESYANFTNAYLHFPLAIFTTKEKSLIGSIKELDNKSWARQQDSGLIEMIHNENSSLKLTKTKNNIEALRLVSEGKVDFTIATLPVTYHIMSKYLFDNIKVAGYTNLSYELSMAVQPEQVELLSILNQALKTITQEQSSLIFQKWVHPRVAKEVIDYTFLGQILFVIVLIISALLYRQKLLSSSNKNLEKSVHQKTQELQSINKNLEDRISKEVEKNRSKDKLLAHQSKMIALSEMLENIAHQWRQPLSMITTSLSGLKLRIEINEEVKKEDILETSQMVIEQTQSLSQTIEDFRRYFTGDTKNKERFNIQEAILKVEYLTKDIFIEYQIEYLHHLEKCMVEYNRNLIIQALINIYNNARDAMIQNNTPIDERFLSIHTKKVSNHIQISIQDSGGGIPLKIIDKIFEPYYTTKHQSVGTGLGLYMTHQIIIKQLKGTLHAENATFSHQNKKLYGAKFTISLPLNN